MITPYDIETKEFSRSMRGFNVDEVNDFLDEIIVDLQKLMDENEALKEKIKDLNQDLTKYQNSEASVMNTIESAKKLMNDISESAERRAEIIIKNAQLDAEVIQRDAKESVAKMTEEGERLRQKVGRYREKYRQLLEDELSQLDGSSEELFAALERDFMPASMDETAATHTQAQQAVQTEKSTKATPRETMIIDEKSLEDILKENYGVGSAESEIETDTKEDLTKTRIF